MGASASRVLPAVRALEEALSDAVDATARAQPADAKLASTSLLLRRSRALRALHAW